MDPSIRSVIKSLLRKHLWWPAWLYSLMP